MKINTFSEKQWHRQRQSKIGTVDNGSEPPDDNGMEARISKIEEFVGDTRERLARIETRLDQTATKSDLHELGMTLHQEINTQTWKLVTFVCGFGTTLVAATYFLVTHAK